MALTTRPIVPGSHVFLFMEGDAYTVPGAGNAGRDTKPGAGDAGWVNIGVIEDSEITLGNEDIKIFRPSPGRLRLYDKLSVKDELTLKFTVKEVSSIAVEVLMRALRLTPSSTQFNPLEGGEKRCWLKFQSYDQEDDAWLTLDVWVSLKISGSMKLGGALIEPQFEAAVLHSQYNTGTL